jgi:hypothetical protein
LIYTAIFLDSEQNYTYDLFDAPHGFAAAWHAIAADVDDRELIAIIPGNQEVGFLKNIESGPIPFLGPRRTAKWSVR